MGKAEKDVGCAGTFPCLRGDFGLAALSTPSCSSSPRALRPLQTINDVLAKHNRQRSEIRFMDT